MFGAVREKLGTAGLVVAILALIIALSGGAYAATQSAKKASKGLTKAQVMALIKANAASGPAGPQGVPGAPGAKGDAGAKGDPGGQGGPGAAGKGVELTPIAPLTPKCSERGGVTVTVKEEAASAKDVCNGAVGAKGDTGEPWTPNSILPAGATETGAWAFTGNEGDTGGMVAPLSFMVQLPSELSEGEVHFQTDADFPTSCKGTAAEPSAEPGQLCVYFNSFAGLGAPVNATFEVISPINFVGAPEAREKGANKAGAAIYFKYSGGPGEAAYGNGSWAVKAPPAGP